MKDELKGELSILMAALFFSISIILVKVLSMTFSALFISLTRFILGIILIISAIKLTGASFKIGNIKDWMGRGIFGAISMITFYISIELASSARASLLNKTYPFFVIIFGYVLFRQKITTKQILSLVLCIVGVMFIFYDGSKYSMLSNLVGLSSGFAAGFAVHYINRLGKQKVSPFMVYLPACLLGLIPSLFSYKEFVKIDPSNLLLILFAGISIFIAQSFLGYGHRYVTPIRGSLLSYSEVLLTMVLSYFIISEQFTAKFFIGVAAVLIGLFIKDKKII